MDATLTCGNCGIMVRLNEETTTVHVYPTQLWLSWAYTVCPRCKAEEYNFIDAEVLRHLIEKEKCGVVTEDSDPPEELVEQWYAVKGFHYHKLTELEEHEIQFFHWMLDKIYNGPDDISEWR